MPAKQKNSLQLINYKIINKTNDEGEIIFYGEVVEEIPRDWWTDQPIDGMFIALDDFMRDLEQMKNKTAITIRINSVGGDFNTGVVIHNLLKDLKAYKTGIVDGLCASAATLIACACDELQVFPSSRFMIHDVKAGLCGWYDKDTLNKVCNLLTSSQEASVQIYIAKCNKTEEEILTLISQETWFVGQKIIDNGFADKLISDDKKDVNFKIENNGKILVANGVKHDISAYKNFPQEDLTLCNENIIEKITAKVINSLSKKQGIDEPISNDAIEQNNIQKENGGKIMASTLEELKNECPELTQKLIAEATEAERNRIQSIEKIQANIGDQEMVNEAKFGTTACSAADLAMRSLEKQSSIGANHLANISNDAANSNAGEVVSLANSGSDELNNNEQKNKQVNMLGSALASEFGGQK